MTSVPTAAGPILTPPVAQATQPIAISWHGSPWSMTGLSFLNFFLTIITLGIYGFWGRTEVRKRIWSSVHVDDEPLAYSGTGKELFLGFLIVFGLLLVPTILITIGAIAMFGPGSGGLAAVQVLMYVAFFYLIGVAAYRARRYRLSRTNWRGIRGALEGNSWAYGWTFFWTAALMFLIFVLAFGGTALMQTLGVRAGGGPPTPAMIWTGVGVTLAGIVFAALLAPWRATKLTRHITNEMQFGSRPFSFTGTAGPLYGRFIARWVGVLILAAATLAAIYFWIGPTRIGVIFRPPVPGQPPAPGSQMTGREVAGLIAILFSASLLFSIITAWYKAVEMNYFAASTKYEGARFKLTATAGGLILLFITNYLITAFSLGILRPVAQARSARYFTQNLALEGPIDVAGIMQSQAALSKTGEGLAQAFDVDAF